MKVFMTGGTGFVGSKLRLRLLELGHEVTVLTRSVKRDAGPKGIHFIEGDPTRPGAWQDRVKDADWVVNLAGSPISRRWTEAIKKQIRESRVLTAKNLVDAIPENSEKTFFSTSAIGYYGPHDDEELYETAPAGNDFLARVAVEWEGEALKAKGKGARVVIMRFGLVLGESGGLLGSLIPLFKRYLGGPIGSGMQWVSWVHLHDLVEAYPFIYGRKEITGPVNITAPHPVRNEEFSRALAEALNVPALLTVPGFAVKLALGEFGSVVLQGQRVLPGVLTKAGFTFKYPDIAEAMRAAVLALY